MHCPGCPINLAIEVLGDRWSLILLRDVMFGGRHYFRELLTGSLEGIASNILADRRRRLVAHGLLWRPDDRTHRQKIRCSLTRVCRLSTDTWCAPAAVRTSPKRGAGAPASPTARSSDHVSP
jgi:DNA-binding HxlR family transcriptional regulator